MEKLRLSNTQREIVAHGDGCLLVVAGPGAGKTRVITERVRRLLNEAGANYRVLALTFTNKAAGEMNVRLGGDRKVADRSFIGTLHSFCTEILANHGERVGVSGLPNILEALEDRKQALRDAVDSDTSLASALLRRDHKRREQALSEWLGLIGEFKRSLLTPDLIRDEFERQLYVAYDAQLRASAVVDFDDLLLLAYRLLEENPKIANLYRRQYPYICIDEAQDLNEAQYRVLCALCGDSHRNVVLVGDPKQAIYTWNGADPKYLDLFVRDFAAKTIELSENFRSAKAIVTAAQILDESYSVEGQLAVDGDVSLRVFEDEVSEAEFVRKEIEELVRTGHPDIEGEITLGRIAVLARSRFSFAKVEAVLQEGGIAHLRKEAAGASQPESDLLNEFMLALRLTANCHDRIHLQRLALAWDIPLEVEAIRDEVRGLDDFAAIGKLAELSRSGSGEAVLSALVDSISASGAFDLLRGLRSLEGEAENYSANERESVLLDVREWDAVWASFIRSRPGGTQTVSAFLAQMALGVADDEPDDGVSLLSVHASKGKEFPVVFLIGMAQGTFPDYRATTPAKRAEERRSAFVACTRSERLLYVTYPKAKLMPWGDSRAQEPSVFFRELWAEFPGAH